MEGNLIGEGFGVLFGGRIIWQIAKRNDGESGRVPELQERLGWKEKNDRGKSCRPNEEQKAAPDEGCLLVDCPNLEYIECLVVEDPYAPKYDAGAKSKDGQSSRD